MRFGIPQDFVVEVESYQMPFHAHQEYLNNSNSSLLQYIEDIKPIKHQEDFHLQLKSFQKTLDHYANEICRDKIEKDLKNYSSLNQYYKQRRQNRNLNINTVINEFNQKLRIQSREVEALIEEEEEKKRQELERRKKIEEERQKKLIEEQKRKEENERKLKQQQEKEKKEQEDMIKKLAKDKEEEEKRLIREKEEAFKKHKLVEEKAKREKLQEEQISSSFEKIEAEFFKYKKDIQSIKENVVLRLNENKDLKKSVNQLKRKINPKFGQLSNSVFQLNKISVEVIELVNMAKNADKLAYEWILNFIAKAIIDQAETEVIVQPAAALPLAKLACRLLNTFSEFEYFLTARFIKKCPFILGYTCSIDSEEGRLRMGWKRRDNKWEDEVKYDERVSGICTVWSVMTRVTDFKQLPQYSFESSWKFLARLLNIGRNLLTNTHFTIASNWWEACAKYFLQRFGKQSVKLLQVLAINWTTSVADLKFPAAARLLILGEDWLHNNRVESIKEMES